jgi:hypothetical protein
MPLLPRYSPVDMPLLPRYSLVHISAFTHNHVTVTSYKCNSSVVPRT